MGADSQIRCLVSITVKGVSVKLYARTWHFLQVQKSSSLAACSQYMSGISSALELLVMRGRPAAVLLLPPPLPPRYGVAVAVAVDADVAWSPIVPAAAAAAGFG